MAEEVKKEKLSLRERQKNLTRSTILNALSEVLIEEGVHGFSVQKCGRSCWGLSQNGLSALP